MCSLVGGRLSEEEEKKMATLEADACASFTSSSSPSRSTSDNRPRRRGMGTERGNKRRREATRSSSRSKTPKRNSSPSTKRDKKFESRDFLCLYPQEVMPESYPTFIRYTKKSPPVNTIVQVDANIVYGCENTEEDFKEFGTPTLDAEQKKMEEYCSECATIVFSNLQLASQQTATSNHMWFSKGGLSEKEKREKCWAMRKNYGVPDYAADLLIGYLVCVYDAFRKGFSDSFGRIALNKILRICLIILGKINDECIMNFGGGSTPHPGSTTTLLVYADIDRTSLEEAEELLGVGETEYKIWVPDCLMFNRKPEVEDEEEYYFFGECKSGYVKRSVLYHQLWHKSLRGLIDSDSVYGCGICSAYMILCKLCVINGILTTHKISVNFVLKLKSKGAESHDFDIKSFLTYIKYMTKILQDKMT